jgi:hypothetical protein
MRLLTGIILIPMAQKYEQEFSKLKYSPYDVPQKYSELGDSKFKFCLEIEEFLQPLPVDVSFNKVLKYIIFNYTIKTPLAAIDNYIKRKVEAGRLADFPEIIDTPDFEKQYEDIILCKNKEVNRMITKFCVMQHDVEFMTLMKYLDYYLLEFNNFEKEAEANKRKYILDNMDVIQKTITSCTEILLNNDNNSLLKESVFELIEEEQRMTPEYIARMREEGKIDLGVKPYGNYEPEPLKLYKLEDN